jgi:tetratricopeptide (TPR) repeat protein
MTKPTRLAVSLSLICLLAAPAAFGDAVLFKTLSDAGYAAIDRSNFGDADRQFQAALKETADFPEKDERKRDLLRAIATVKESRGRLTEAADTWKQVLEIDEKVRGESSPEVAVDLTGYASLSKKLGMLVEAEAAATRAVTILEKKSQSSDQLLTALKAQGIIYQAGGKYSLAEATFRKALAIAQKGAGKGQEPYTAPQLELLARLYIDQGKVTDAEPLLKQSVTERETKLGTDHRDTVHGELELARLYAKLGRFDEAEALLKKGMASLEKNPQGNDEYSDLVAALSKIYLGKDNTADAVKMLQKAVDLQKEALGEQHPKVAELLRQLAGALAEADEYVAAEVAAQDALGIAMKVSGADIEVTNKVSTLATVFLRQGKYDKAEKLYLYALQKVGEAGGSKHPDFSQCLNALGLLYYDRGEFDKAARYIAKATTTREEQYGPDNYKVGHDLEFMSRILISQQKYPEAEAKLKRSLQILTAAVGESHPDTADVTQKLAQLYATMQQNEQAEKYFRKLLKRDEEALGPDSGPVASDLESLAQALVAQGKTDEAVGMQKRANGIKAKLPGYHAETPNMVTTGDAPPPEINKPVADKWALVVGVSNFKDTGLNLKYAAKDATDFRNYLVNEAGFAPDHIKLLLDADATRENITQNLGDKFLGKAATCNDLVVIYISTHGSNAVAALNNANFIVPHDATLNNLVLTGIPMKYLTAGIKDLVHCNRVVLIADVCHGGAMGEDTSPTRTEKLASANGNVSPDGKGVRRASGVTAKDGIEVGAGQLIIASSEADQISWESKSYPNGVFTRKLIDGLRQKGIETSLKDAYLYMKSRVEEEVLRDRAEVQTPVFVANMWKGNEVILGVKPLSPGPGIQQAAEAAPIPVSTARSATKGAKGGSAPNTVKPKGK